MHEFRWRGGWDKDHQSFPTNGRSVVSLGLWLHLSIIVKAKAWGSVEGCRDPIGGPEIQVPTQEKQEATRTSHAIMCAWCRALTGKPRIAASIRTFRWVRGSDAQSFVPSVSCGRRLVEGRSRLTQAFRTRTSFRIRHVDTRFQRLFNARK